MALGLRFLLRMNTLPKIFGLLAPEDMNSNVHIILGYGPLAASLRLTSPHLVRLRSAKSTRSPEGLPSCEGPLPRVRRSAVATGDQPSTVGGSWWMVHLLCHWMGNFGDFRRYLCCLFSFFCCPWIFGNLWLLVYLGKSLDSLGCSFHGVM